MESYINVIGNGQKTVKVAAKPNGVVSVETLRHAFCLESDVVFGLFRNGIALECDGSVFYLQNGWIGANFELTWEEARRSRPATPLEPEAVPCKKAKIFEQKESNAKDLQWFQSLQQYALFYEDEKKTKHCITPLTKQIAATYAHGSHENLTKEYTEEKPIIVRCYYNKEYRVEGKVVTKNNALDVVILQAVSENFFKNNPPTAVPEIGTRYLMLGLSNIENRDNPFSLGYGNVTAMLEDKARFVGSSGSSNGDSGAGLWNSSEALIGMNIMVKHNPLQIKQTSDNRQKQFTYAIGGACVFIPVGVIKLFASEYIPDEPPIPFEE